MIITVKNEAPFQVLTGAFTIGPSPTGYELQVGATPQSFTTLFSVGANTPRMVTNVANGSYYRLKNNVGDVKVNWSHTCIDNQGGGGSGSGSTYTAGEYIQIENDVISVTGITPDLYLTTADTQDFVTEADITAATSPIQEQLDDIERVTATALTELHDSILELSGATQDFVTEEDLTGYTSMQDFEDFQDAISVKEEVIASAITELHDSIPDVSDFVTTGDIADMVTTGDIQNFVTSGDVATQISTATADMVESTSISTIWKGTQAQYDAITTKDPNTFYIITNS